MNKDFKMLAEAYERILIEQITKFSKLPDKMPYGFVVYPDGSIDEVIGMYNHVDAVKERGYKDLDAFLDKGGTHLVYDNEGDQIVYIGVSKRGATKSTKALKTAKDIALWYNKEYEVIQDF